MVEESGTDQIMDEQGNFTENWPEKMPDGVFEKDDAGQLKLGQIGTVKDFPNLVKMTLNQEKQLGSAKKIPDRETEPEEWNEFMNDIAARGGRPETAEGYQVKLPDDAVFDEEVMPDILQFFFENRFSQETAQGAIDKFHNVLNLVTARIENAEKEHIKEVKSKLTEEWGGKKNYDVNLKLASQAAAHFGGEELAKYYEVRKRLHHPAELRAWYKVHQELLKEGRHVKGDKTISEGDLKKIEEDKVLTEMYGPESDYTSG